MVVFFGLSCIGSLHKKPLKSIYSGLFGILLGTVGMSAIMAANLCPCSNIIAVGGNEESLALAKELGATHTINRKECKDIVGEICY